jgi:hypothetical protein
VPFQTNGSGNTSQAGINLKPSTANAVGLTVTPTNPGTNQETFEITGSSYLGNSATATALASVPTQCSGQVATGIAANGNANCTSITGLTLQTNGTNNSSQTTLNLQSSSTNTTGLTFTETNVSSGNVKGEVAGGLLTPTYGGSGVSVPTAHTVPVAEGASAMTFISPGASGLCNMSNGTSADPSYQTCPGNNFSGGTQYGQAYAAGATTITSNSPPTTKGLWYLVYNLASDAAAAPSILLGGLSSRALTGSTATDTILYSDSLKIVEHDSAATHIVTETLPTPTTLENTSFGFSYVNHTALYTDVISPTTWTINGSATLSVAPGSQCRVSVDTFNSNNWLADCAPATLAAGVTSFSGDGALLTNSLSTGGVTAVLGTTTAYSLWGRNAGTTGTPAYTALTCNFLPAFTGDTTSSAGSCAQTTSKINGTSFTGTVNDLVAFGSGGNIPLDSGILYTNVATAAANYASGNLIQGAGANKTTSDSGVATTNLTLTTTTPAANQICVFGSTAKTCTPTTTLPTAAEPAHTGDVTNSAGSLSTTVAGLHFGATGLTLSTSTPPTSGQCLYYNGTNITGSACSGGGMTWPSAAGVAIYAGSSAWGTSFTGTANDVVAIASGGANLLDTGVLYTNLAKINTANTFSQNGASSASAMNFTGTVYTGGTGTTTTPLVYWNQGAAPSTWSTSGTELGINAPSGYSGNFEDFHVNGGASVWNVSYQGIVGAGTWQGAAVANTYGGTGLNSSSSTGVPNVSSGTWAISTTLPSGLSATNMALTTPSLGSATGISLTLGTDNSSAGTLQLANSAANAHTIWSSGATTSNTINGFAVVPTTGHLIDCTVTSTTCLLHDSGVVTANVVNASSPGAGVAHFAGSTQTVTSSAVVGSDMSNGTVTATQLATSQVTRTATFTDLAPVSGDSGLIVLIDPPTAIHLTRIWCAVQGSTNVVLNLDKRTEGAIGTDSGAHLLGAGPSDITAVTGGVNSSTWNNTNCGGTGSCAIGAHAPVVVTITSVSGTPTALSCGVDYTVD